MTRSTVTIQRPIEDVFAVLTNVELTGRWYPARVEEWWTSPPPHGVGSTRRARVRVLGRPVENDAVVTAYDPPHLASLKGISRNAPFDVRIVFEAVAEGTRVDVDSMFDLKGIMRLIGTPFVRNYDRGWARGLANMKRLMESGEL